MYTGYVQQIHQVVRLQQRMNKIETHSLSTNSNITLQNVDTLELILASRAQEYGKPVEKLTIIH
jgi:hypothetical protein